MVLSQSLTLAELLRMGAFEPAKIQREFQWQRPHVERLLDDLLGAFQRSGGVAIDQPDGLEVDTRDPSVWDGDAEAANAAGDVQNGDVANGDQIASLRSRPVNGQTPDVYFLGSVIFLKTPRSKTYAVYDGLQRLTSLTLFLATFRDTWAGATPADKAALNGLLFLDDASARLEFKTAGQSLSSVLAGRKAPNRGNLTEGDRNMRAAAEYFRKTLVGWTGVDRRAFLAFLQKDVVLTVTEVDNPSVAYQMFVGANTRGLRLDIGDTLKGTLAEQLRYNGGTIAEVDTCATVWRDAQNRLRKSFNDFVHAVEVLKFRPHYRHATGELIADMFDDKTPPASIIDWIQGDFKTMLSAYERARNHNRQEIATDADISFRQLSFLGWTEWQAYYIAMALTHKDLHSSKFSAEVATLQRICFMIELAGWSESKRRRRFLEAIGQREANINPFTRNGGAKGKGALWPDLAMCAQAKRALRFDLTTNERRGAIVRWIETLHWGKNVPSSATNDSSVEHVLPVTATESWAAAFSDDAREACTNRLGNLFILDKDTNEKIGNRDWHVKIEAYRKHRLTFRGAGLVVDHCQMLAAVGQAVPWNAQTVADLTEVLAAKAEKALALG
jgi:Protein of unknown function DUF262/Protein of unknown function (DUF1524)